MKRYWQTDLKVITKQTNKIIKYEISKRVLEVTQSRTIFGKYSGYEEKHFKIVIPEFWLEHAGLLLGQ